MITTSQRERAITKIKNEAEDVGCGASVADSGSLLLVLSVFAFAVLVTTKRKY